METFRIEVGHVHGVKPGNIVGAIANEADLESRYIGRIDIRDDYSLVDLPEGMPSDLFMLLKKVWVSGQQLRITRGGDAPERETSSRPPTAVCEETAQAGRIRQAEEAAAETALDCSPLPLSRSPSRLRERVGLREGFRSDATSPTSPSPLPQAGEGFIEVSPERRVRCEHAASAAIWREQRRICKHPHRASDSAARRRQRSTSRTQRRRNLQRRDRHLQHAACRRLRERGHVRAAARRDLDAHSVGNDGDRRDRAA